jgi:hypothetical protein
VNQAKMFGDFVVAHLGAESQIAKLGFIDSESQYWKPSQLGPSAESPAKLIEEISPRECGVVWSLSLVAFGRRNAP